MYEEWVLDVSLPVPAYVPYDRKNDVLVTGLNIMSTECPGKFAGIIHQEGQEALDKWIEEHPDWDEVYKEQEESNEH